MSFVIRPYRAADLPAVAELFYRTVHTVNAADYTSEQLRAWAPSADSLCADEERFLRQNTLVAEDGGELVGFASMEGECLDMLYVRADRLREGIASALCDALEDGAASVTVYASLTARPFFEKRGYATVRKNTALRRDIPLTNFLMRLDN